MRRCCSCRTWTGLTWVSVIVSCAVHIQRFAYSLSRSTQLIFHCCLRQILSLKSDLNGLIPISILAAAAPESTVRTSLTGTRTTVAIFRNGQASIGCLACTYAETRLTSEFRQAMIRSCSTASGQHAQLVHPSRYLPPPFGTATGSPSGSLTCRTAIVGPASSILRDRGGLSGESKAKKGGKEGGRTHVERVTR